MTRQGAQLFFHLTSGGGERHDSTMSVTSMALTTTSRKLVSPKLHPHVSDMRTQHSKNHHLVSSRMLRYTDTPGAKHFVLHVSPRQLLTLTLSSWQLAVQFPLWPLDNLHVEDIQGEDNLQGEQNATRILQSSQ